MTPFTIPEDFRTFMQKVVAYLDLPDPNKLLDAEDALRDDVGHGGRIDGVDTYRFVYITADGHCKWELILKEAAVRDIADGFVVEIEGEKSELARSNRRPFGDALLIWGEYGDDALRLRNHRDMITALDLLHEAAHERPVTLRLWSRCDDQVVAVLSREQCALYVVESLEGYGTSVGDPRIRDSFEASDHDGKPFEVPLADCIPWDRARNALLNFADQGNLGPEIKVDGRIPSVLLMLGDVDRKAALAARAEAPRELSRSSIPRMTPPAQPVIADDDTEEGDEPDQTQPVELQDLVDEAPVPLEDLNAWARRLIELLHARELIELGKGNLDEISYQLGGLLQAHGTEAEHSLDTAEWLANEIGAVSGIDRIFATAGDLQLALRRSRVGQ
ncbi:MAG TPA: hypothetical protein VFQ53_20870 [Kofleriaceae bacterium]|nr:hypothetical protein [Kofleriaceae bacterium]